MKEVCKNLGFNANWFVNRLHNILLMGVKDISRDEIISNHIYWIRWSLSPDNAKLIFLSKRYFGLFRCDKSKNVIIKCRQGKKELREPEVVDELSKYAITDEDVKYDTCFAEWVRSRDFVTTVELLFDKDTLSTAKWYYQQIFSNLESENLVKKAVELTNQYVREKIGVVHPPILSTSEWITAFIALLVEEPLKKLGIDLPKWLIDPNYCSSHFSDAHYRANKRIRYNWLVDLMVAEPEDLDICSFTNIRRNECGDAMFKNGAPIQIALEKALQPRVIAKYLAFDILVFESSNYEEYVMMTTKLIWESYEYLNKLLGSILDIRCDGKPIKTAEEYQRCLYSHLRRYITISETDIPGTFQLMPLVSRVKLAQDLVRWCL